MTEHYSIGTDSRVTLHFAITLDDGTEIDSTFDKKPATFVVGDGNLLPGFEQALFGMVSGQEATLAILPEQGFGMPNPANIQRFKPEQFDANVDLHPGVVMTFQDAANTDLPGVIATVAPDLVTVDFNHPLAGRTLNFVVKILDVAPVGDTV